MAYIWELLAAIGTIIIFLYSYNKKRYLITYFIGIGFGLLWETAAEQLFNYQNIFAFYIWNDIPLAIVIGWGISLAGFQIISDLIQKRYKIKYNSLKSIASDALVAGIIGSIMEYLGSHNLALWTYPSYEIIIFDGIPLIWLVGWFALLGIICLVRRLESALKLSKP